MTKRARWLAFALLALICCVGNAQAAAADFRNMTWGMTLTQVESSEGNPPALSDGSAAVYDVMVANMDATLVYLATNDVVVASRYSVDTSKFMPSDYVTSYEKVKSLLTDKYGKPTTDDVQGSDAVIGDPGQWGMYVMLGELSFTSSWKMPNTIIELNVGATNGTVDFGVTYVSTKFEKDAVAYANNDLGKGL